MFLSILLILVKNTFDMISVSFYLLNPKANSQSQLYVSISNKSQRLRFPVGEKFLTEYCHVRKKKGTKELVKRNTPFYFEYNSKLTSIRDVLIRIEMELRNEDGTQITLEQIRDTYYLRIGRLSDPKQKSFFEAYASFVQENLSGWSEATYKIFNAIRNHLERFEELFGTLSFSDIDVAFWNRLRDDYFVKEKKFGNNSTNKYLRAIKQFLRFAVKKGFINQSIDFTELKYLTEIEPYKIALKEQEVEDLMNLNLSQNLRLDKVRDLFVLEVLTGQRYSDVPKLLDKKNISETNIQFYQQKTGEKVTIPLHPRLKKHLNYIFKKYPEGLPELSNQKFNQYLKEVCQQAGIIREHSWITLSGKKRIAHSDYRFNLVTSHTGRRTFCTLALKSGIDSEHIMKVTGHRSYDQFREYVKVDDEDLEVAFEGMLNS